MADIQLIIGADENLSLTELKGGISSLISKLNGDPPKIKIDLDKKNAEEQINRLKNQIKELGTEASKVKFGANLSSSLNGINNNISALSKSIADIGKNTGLSNISEGFERLVPVIENLKGELKSLQGAISSFQGVNINLGMTGDAFSRNAAYGQSARQSISELRTQAQQIEQYLAEYYKISDRAAAAMKAISGTDALKGKDIFAILGNANNSKLSLSAQMDALREYIALLERAAKVKGINLSPVKESFSASAEKIVENTRKIQTGEQQLEVSTEKLKSVFGSGVNAGALTEQLNQIHTAIVNVNEAIASLNTESNPFASLQGSIAQIVTSLEQLNVSVTNISTILSNGAVSTGEMSAQLSNEATQAQNAAAANDQYFNALSELLQVVRQYIADTQAEREADRETAKAKEEAAAKAREAAKQKREAAKAEKDAAKESEQEEKERQQLERQTAQLHQRAANLIATITSRLQQWTAAERSSNQESRAAYQALENVAEALRQADAACDSSAESVRNLDRATRQASSTLKTSETTLKANGDATKSFADRMGGLASKFGAWLSVSQVIMYAYRAIRKMVSASIELESAMVQMQVVTKASNEEMRKFGDEAAKVAQKTATSITDVISSSTTYARLGYSMDESKQLAEYTSMLQKVGDIDVSDAQDAITAIIKAYDIGADGIESVMDKLVETGNNFPISVSQIAEGMNNASSALAAAGNSFEQSVALLTSANTTVQNAAKSSTGLRTIAARIRKTKTELDDLGEAMTDADYEALVSGLTNAGVSLKNANGEFRSTYDIIKDIAGIWDKLSSMEQSGLATALSGTRQQAIFYSMVKNFKEASGAMDSMADSTGALDDAFGIVSDTTEARIERMKAKFQEMGSDLMSSDALGFFVDRLKGVMDLLDGFIKLLDKIPFASGGVTTAIGAIATSLSAVKNIGRVRMFTLKMNMPIVTIVLFGYEQFRCYG